MAVVAAVALVAADGDRAAPDRPVVLPADRPAAARLSRAPDAASLAAAASADASSSPRSTACPRARDARPAPSAEVRALRPVAPDAATLAATTR